ncbi:MAG: TIGR03564 family F420-dependent LLM class oxidoreductase [Acidimicrobiia bacterium]|nr:TIGR03564 family F420-dependent LLM class oxidoreductase [Acidimicrobiia bacterium]
MRIGTMLSMPGDPVATAGLRDRAAEAEEAGFASAWLPQVGTVDALTALALAGTATSQIELGTAVVPTYPRHPTALAEQALTVQDATGNRLALGVGLSHRFLIENSLGLDYSRPIAHTREYLAILSGLLAGEAVRFEGELYRVKAQVAVGSAAPPPVLVAALGPGMLRLCGRLADGTITWMGGIDYLRDVAVPTMGAAAAAAGRPAPRFVAMVPVLLSDDAAAGRDMVNETFTMYGRIPSYRATLDRGGAAEPADVAVIGDAEAIVAGLDAFATVGVTDFAAVVPRSAPSAAATTELLAELARARISEPSAGSAP